MLGMENPQETDFILLPDVKGNTMMNVQEFKKRYYKNRANYDLKLDSGDNLPTGEFDRYSLGISFSGIDQIYLNKARSVLREMEESSRTNGVNEELPIGQLISRYPKLLTLFIGQELQAHEYFHLFQTLTLPACFCLYKASRELASLRVIVFVHYVKLGGKFNLDTFESLFDAMGLIDDSETKEYLEGWFDLYKGNISIIENFYEYEKKNSSLNVVDLMEGSAYAFQKIINRSAEVDTFNPDKDSCYRKAKSYFVDNGGNDDIIFLILMHMSLKYGLLDSGDFMEFMLTPQEIYEGLCENIAEYEESLYDVPHPAAISFFGQYSYAEKLNKWGFDIEKEDIRFLDDVPEIDDKSLYVAGEIVFLIKSIKKHIKEMFTQNRIKFKGFSMDIDETRASAIDKNIRRKFSSYDSDLFFALLLVDQMFSVDFFVKHLPKERQIEYKGLFGENTTTIMDDNLYKLVNNFDLLLQNKMTYCCEEHGVLRYEKLINNNSENCLNRTINNLLGIGLGEIVQ